MTPSYFLCALASGVGAGIAFQVMDSFVLQLDDIKAAPAVAYGLGVFFGFLTAKNYLKP